MYEIEVEHVRLESSELPGEIKSLFHEPEAEITHYGLINWEEHCTECGWPHCYQTCDLYNPRNDGHCRRTLDGFSPVMDAPTFAGQVVRVRFKRWASLTGNCRLNLSGLKTAIRTEKVLDNLALLASRAPNVGASLGKPGVLSRLARKVKGFVVDGNLLAKDAVADPDYFVIEAYNPSPVAASLSFLAYGRGDAGEDGKKIPYQKLLYISPGFQRIKIPFSEMSAHFGSSRHVGLSLSPNILQQEDEGLTLYFGRLTFVKDAKFGSYAFPSIAATGSDKKIKVLAWDLDNTVWNGVLVEDGPEGISLKPGIKEVIVELDQRGIINSVVSKNNEELALAQLDRFGLKEYMVSPVISWGPKSEAIRHLMKTINVGEDTIAFIDDSPFEREEVRTMNPQIRIYPEDAYMTLPDRDEFDVPKTDEAKKRRVFYQEQALRKAALDGLSGDYLEFLRRSNIRLNIMAPDITNTDRIHELVQRTNQMNFSGSKYTRPEMLGILEDSSYDHYLMNAEDNYGKYGYIGFCLVRKNPPRVVDLMFSCRIQSKRIEHAFMIFLMNRYKAEGFDRLEVAYNKNERNYQVAQVFSDLGLREAARDGNRFLYDFDLSAAIPQDSIITTTWIARNSGQ